MLNTSDVKTVISGTESIWPFNVAVDWVADNIYWTDMKHKFIAVARLDGTSQKTIVTDLMEPISLALFPRLGYVFWTEWGDHAKIQRALLDGSNQKDIVSTDLAYPNGISIDYAGLKLFWADSLKDRIETSDLHGRYRVTLISGYIDPFGLTQVNGSSTFKGRRHKYRSEQPEVTLFSPNISTSGRGSEIVKPGVTHFRPLSIKN